MPAPFDNIVQHLFHQPSLQSVTVDELERMAQQHPYFAAAHFLLLKKMQDTAHPQFNSQLHKTTLYFNNPLWLQFLLQPESVTNFTVSDKTPFIESETAMQPPAPVEESRTAEMPAEISAAAEQIPLSETARENNAYNNAGVEENKAGETPAEILLTEHYLAAPVPVAEPVYENNEYAAESSSKKPDQAGMMDLIMEVFDEDKNLPVPEKIPLAAADESITQVVNEMTAEPVTEQIQETNISEKEIPGGPVAINEHEGSRDTIITPGASMQGVDETNIGAEPDAIIGEQEKPLVKTVIETDGAKNDFLFEPYHTVDYFASQGIKLSKTEAEPKDKLGRQLKSFTEWLKTMKKLPQASIDKILAQNEESKVVEDAIHSIETKEVITEAMAEVFEKQGLTEKAAEVYQKLSLLNPGKSAYFAARMEDLKH